MSSLRDRLLRTTHFSRCEWETHSYQDYATDWLWTRPFSAAFIDTGLGKTIILLMLIARLLMENIEERILIIAPVRVAAQTWPNEFPEWEHTRWMEDSHTVLRAEDDDPEVVAAFQEALAEASYWHPSKEARKIAGKAATKKKEELRIARAMDGKSIHVINREALTWLVDLHSTWTVRKRNGKTVRIRKVVSWPYKTVIIDESSSFKDHTTARFKALVAVRAQGFITRLHELTATPAAEGYMGVFAQIFLLDRGERLGANITAYREEFFVQNAYSKKWKIRPGAEDIISERIADICLVMKTKDYRDEEEPLFLPRKLKMTPEEQKQYRQFEREFVLTLADGTQIEAETAASLSAKLLQLASGAVYQTVTQENEETGETEFLKMTHHVHDHKIDDLRQLQEELGDEPILVAYWYKSSLARLKKAFPEAVVMDKSGKVVSRHGPWNSGKIKMLLVHPAGVGHGLNMQYGPGHDLYLFDACWSYELFYQLYCRLHRQGQRKRVRVHLPQMIGTNDELVVGRLGEKEDAQEILFTRIRALWKKWKARNV